MNIPNVVYRLGDEVEDDSVFAAIGKHIKIDKKDTDKEKYVIFLDFNLDADEIAFDYDLYKESVSEKTYNYFGNNSAAGLQTYVVRETKNLGYYWNGRKYGIFQNIYDVIADGHLKDLLKELKEKGFFSENGLTVDKITISEQDSFEVIIEGKEISYNFNNEKKTEKELIKIFVGNGDKSINLFIVPRIIKNNEKIVISQHEDYITYVTSALGASAKNTKNNKQEYYLCHICGKRKHDVDTIAYSTKLSRKSINKIFVTTTINLASDFNKNNYNNDYAICEECYKRLQKGESQILEKFKVRIAGENALLLIEGIYKELGYTNMEKAKGNIDYIFNTFETGQRYEEIIEDLENEQHVNLYEFSIAFYETDGNSFSIKQTIDNISSFRLYELMELFEAARSIFDKQLKHFNLSHIYGIIPVKTNKKKKQINIGRVIDVYKALLGNEILDKNMVIELCLEALEKGINQLRSKEITNYNNLNLLYYLNQREQGIDWYIQKIVMSYTALLQVTQNMNILDKEVFHVAVNNNDSEVTSTGALVETENSNEQLNGFIENINESEKFLDKQGYSNIARSRFYLGRMIYSIGVAQSKKGHKDKPVMKKIDFQGMNDSEIVRLYLDSCEKTVQYSIQALNDTYIERFHIYNGFKSSKDEIQLTEHENVLYVMAGYGYSVGAMQTFMQKKNSKDTTKTTDKGEQGNDSKSK